MRAAVILGVSIIGGCTVTLPAENSGSYAVAHTPCRGALLQPGVAAFTARNSHLGRC